MQYQFNRNYVLFFVCLLLCIPVIWVLIVPLAAGIVLGFVCEQPLDFFQQKWGRHGDKWRWTLSVTMVMLILMAFIVPFCFFILNILRQANTFFNSTNYLLPSEFAEAIAKRVSEQGRAFGITVSIAEVMTQAKMALLRLSGSGASSITGVLSATPRSFIDAIVFFMSWCLFLAKGSGLRAVLLPVLLPWPKQRNLICATTGDVLRAVIVSNVLVSVVQALVVFLFLWLTGTPQPMLFGGLAFFCSFIPIVGTAPIMIGGVVYALGHGMNIQALVLVIGAILVGGVDNVLRPYFAKGGSSLNFFWIFIAFVGGISQFGIAGSIIGPLVFSLFSAAFTVLQRDLKYDVTEV